MMLYRTYYLGCEPPWCSLYLPTFHSRNSWWYRNQFLLSWGILIRNFYYKIMTIERQREFNIVTHSLKKILFWQKHRLNLLIWVLTCKSNQTLVWCDPVLPDRNTFQMHISRKLWTLGRCSFTMYWELSKFEDDSSVNS